MDPLTDRHQILIHVITFWMPIAKQNLWTQSIQGFLLHKYAKYTPSLFACLPILFRGFFQSPTADMPARSFTFNISMVSASSGFNQTLVIYTVSQKKRCKFWSGIPQNYKNQFWWHLAEIFKSSRVEFACFRDEKLIKKQTYTKIEAYKLYSTVFWIFLPNVVKIDPYNFDVYVSKFACFFLKQCRRGLILLL